jgi:hypothetical protein
MEWWQLLGIVVCFGAAGLSFWFSEEGEEF